MEGLEWSNLVWMYRELVVVHGHCVSIDKANARILIHLPLKVEITIEDDKTLPLTKYIVNLVFISDKSHRISGFFSGRPYVSKISREPYKDGWKWLAPDHLFLVYAIDDLRKQLLGYHLGIKAETVALMDALRKSRTCSRDMARLIGQFYYAVAVQQAKQNL